MEFPTIRVSKHPDDQPEERLRELQIEKARQTRRWHELEAVDLVKRGPRLFVSASTDVVLRPYPGVVFPDGSALPLADRTELWFTVDDGEMRFYERLPGVESWTQHLEQQAERERRRKAPRPKPAWMESTTS